MSAVDYPSELRRRLARHVRLLRTARAWSQEELAARSGLHRTYIGAIERAERNPTLDNVARIARALRVSAAVLLSDAPLPAWALYDSDGVEETAPPYVSSAA